MTTRLVREDAAGEARPRQRWPVFAVLLAAVQIGILWLVSAPPPVPPAPSPATLRFRLLTEIRGGSSPSASADPMAWLLTPGVFLLPSVHDFSGAGWLEAPALEVAIEAFSPRWRELGYRPVRTFPTGLAPIARADPGPGGQAAIPEGSRPVPNVPPVPLPAEGRVRILEGLRGWNLPDRIPVPPIGGERIPQSAVVRVMIDARGDLASPPVIWEPSEDAGADEVALGVVRGLRLKRASAGGRPPAGPGFEWGLIAVAWPAPAQGTNAVSTAHEP